MIDLHAMQYRSVSDAYKTSSYFGLNQREAMAEVLRHLMGNLYAAKDAYLAHKLDVMSGFNSKTLRIVAVLRDTIHASGAMEDAEAAPHARTLSDRYHVLFTRLTNVLRAEDPVVEYDTLIAILKPLHQVWSQADTGMPLAASTDNAI